MNKKRLLKLADFLETVPRKRFDMTQWSQSADFSPRKCGTAACALGWATTIPSFRRQGLHAVTFQHIDNIVPAFNRYEGYDAGQAFFGLNRGQAYRLFDYDEYAGGNATPKQVAKRIRKLVAEKSDEQ